MFSNFLWEKLHFKAFWKLENFVVDILYYPQDRWSDNATEMEIYNMRTS